jgi:hypothetical protein
MEQSMEVGDHIRGGAGLRDGVAAAEAHVAFVPMDAGDRPRPVVGADAGEAGNGGQHHLPAAGGVGAIPAPVVAPSLAARFEHDGGAAGTATFQIQPATTADVDEAGEITLHGTCSC